MGGLARGIVVQKFGGTSLADPDSRASLTERVRERLEDGYRVVVVVSAMGRSGSPYATDTLLGLVGGLPEDLRERDRLAACGEIISSVVVAHSLQSEGIPARSLSGAEAGILTDGTFGAASVTSVEPSLVLAAFDEGLTPVVAGFQGLSLHGELTTLGRGGSDTTACVLAAVLEADLVEIFTDVDGVMTADPAILEEARVLDSIEYREVFQMARHGSRIVHISAAEAAREADIPVRVRSTFSGAPGTLISADASAPAASRPIAVAVSHLDHIARFTVALPPDDTSGGHMRAQTEVYRSMAEVDVSLDMFTPYGDSLVFSIREADAVTAIRTLDEIVLPYAIETGLAKVTLVGAGMHGVPGVMARMADALRQADVTIRQVADSHTTISVLICQNDRSKAVRALHEAFGLGEGRM